MQELKEHGAEAPHRDQWSKGKSGRIQQGEKTEKQMPGGKDSVGRRLRRPNTIMPEREQGCQGVTGPAPQMKPCEVPHSSEQVLLEF